MTDSLGRKIDFKNTVIIMTSNVGTRKLKEFGAGIGFSTNSKKENLDEHTKSVLNNSLKKTFAPEFLNRLDDVLLFNNLSKENIDVIIDIEIEKLKKRIKVLKYELQLSKKAKNYIAKKGFDENFGARPLKRAIQKYIEDPFAEEIILGKVKEGDKIKIDYNEKEDLISLTIKN